MVITKIEGIRKEDCAYEKEVHRVYLTYEEMLKRHQRLRTDKGLELAIDLPSTENLMDQAILFESEEKVIYIEALPEKAFVIKPKDKYEWGIACYNIGNMHKVAYLNENEILVPYERLFEHVLDKTGIDYETKEKKISGIRANVDFAAGAHRHD